MLGKPAIFSDSLEKKYFSKSKSVKRNNVSNDFSKPVTAQILPLNNKSIFKENKCDCSRFGYNAVPPPYTGNFMPLKPDLSGLEELMDEPIVSEPTTKMPVVKTSEAKASADKPKVVRKNFGPPLIEDWITDSEDEAESKPKIEKKTVKPSFAKIEFVKSKEQGNPQMDLQDKGVIDSGCSRHMIGNMSYLTDYEEIDGGYFSFGGNPKGGKITSKGKFDGKVDERFFVGNFMNSKVFRIFNSRTRIVKENLYIRFSENTPNIVGSRPNWLFNIDTLTKSMNYKAVVAGNQSKGNAGTKACDDAGKASMETVPGKDYILLPLWTTDLSFSQS
uniref:Uncharacterized protein n=1 Tax=Tanacetum cinerariifolium TaxID=118510 RepID=A0A6L2KJ08_TANCI|nr:hypothetical protein [Tanacetum cinerariifolium]